MSEIRLISVNRDSVARHYNTRECVDAREHGVFRVLFVNYSFFEWCSIIARIPSLYRVALGIEKDFGQTSKYVVHRANVWALAKDRSIQSFRCLYTYFSSHDTDGAGFFAGSRAPLALSAKPVENHSQHTHTHTHTPHDRDK